MTKMLIKVDLQCSRCCNKIKKILCKIPQIRDQIYDERQNTVLITVVCCSPENIRQKIICKGGETVQSVEILHKKVTFLLPAEDTKPPAPTPVPAPLPKSPKPAPPKPLQQVPSPPPLQVTATPPLPGPNPVAGYPQVPVYPMAGVCCCRPSYRGYGGGPCYCGRRWPGMCYDGSGRPACEYQAGNRGYSMSQCDYFSEEDATGCTVM